MKKYLVFEITGGAGKNIMGTALLNPLKEKFPDRDIIVVASWPETVLYHPVPSKVYRLGHTPNFYHNYIENKDTIVLKHDPYYNSDYIMGKNHLIPSWFNMYNLDYNGHYPDIRVNASFLDSAFSKKNTIDKPILLIHTNGGSVDENRVRYSWTRDMPYYVAKGLVERHKDNYYIIQVGRREDDKIEGVNELVNPSNMSMLDAFCLLKISDKRLLIDSSLQHVAASWQLPSVVLWIGTCPKRLGYSIHKNITPHKDTMKNHKLPNSYLEKYQLWGAPVECPFDGVDIFDVDIIEKELML